MTTVFIAAVAFCLGLIAFCASVWLTTWASASSGQYSEMAAAKLTGYFVTILSILSLVLTSYYGARSIMVVDNYRGMPIHGKKWQPGVGKQHHPKGHAPSKTSNKSTTTSSGSTN